MTTGRNAEEVDFQSWWDNLEALPEDGPWSTAEDRDQGKRYAFSAFMAGAVARQGEVDDLREALGRIAAHDDLDPLEAGCDGDCESSMKAVAQRALDGR